MIIIQYVMHVVCTNNIIVMYRDRDWERKRERDREKEGETEMDNTNYVQKETFRMKKHP